MRDYYDNDYNNTEYYKKENGGTNTGLIVIVSVLSCLLVAVIIAAIVLCTVVLKGNNNDGEDTAEATTTTQSTETVDSVVVESVNPNDTKTVEQKTTVIKQAVPVNKYMYIGNCNVSVTLRTGPGTDFGEVCQLEVGEEVYVNEYTTDDFAKVNYNGQSGYVMRKYVVTTRPQVWDYDVAAVQSHVAGAFKAFVNGVNTGDTSYASVYYAGDELTQELKTREKIDSDVLSEEILSLNCHGVARVSPSRVSCLRDSTTRVTYNDGSVKDITERFKYIVDLSSGSMKIVDITK